ncbi:MAG: TetR family transcriptional regulator [Eubacterium sp.]|nr:TetR family transcriptional regulator [Eubacterium sp.]
MEKKNGESTEEALKAAARKLLGANCKDGTEVTARAITKEAGVNLAMINYCFGSKEALIFEVFKDIQREGFKCKPELAEIMNSDMPPKQKLIERYYQILNLMLDYFSMSQAVVKFCVFNKGLGNDSTTFALVKEHFDGKKSDGECMLIAYQIASVHELMILRHEEIKETCGIDLEDRGVLRQIITENIDKLIGE